MDDQRIKLILELAGVSDVAELRAQLDGLNAAGGTAAKGLGQVEDQLREETAAIAEAVRQQKELKAATDACAKADADLNKALRDDAAAELRAKLAALDIEAGDVAEAFAKDAISARMFAKDMDVIGDESAQLKAQLAGLEQAQRSEAAATDRATAAKDRLAKATRKAGQGMTGFSQSMLQTGRIVQDVVQGGIGGGINNIEGFVQAIGLGSGAAGALTILGTAFLVLRPQIEEFVGSVGKLWESFKGEGPRAAIDVIKTLEARVKELSEKPMRLRVEQAQLDESQKKLDALKRGLAEYNAQQGQQNVHEAESGKLVQEALTESATGAAGVEDKAVAAIRDRMERADVVGPLATAEKKAAEADLIRARKSMEFARDLGAQQQALRDAEDAQRRLTAAALREEDARNKIAEAARAEYGDLLARAKTGHGKDQAEAQADLAKQLRGVGEEGVAVGIEAAKPDQIREDAQFIERQQRRAKLDKELAKKAADDLEASAKEARDRVKDKLDEFKAQGGVEATAKEFQQEADTKGLKGADAFNHVRDGLMTAIEGALKGANLDVKFSRDQIADLATSAAGGARKADARADEKAAKDEAKDAIATPATRARIRRENEQEDAAVKGSGIGLDAGRMLAEVQAAGGATDDKGRFRKLDADQQFEHVRRQVAKWLHRQTGVDQFGRKTFANPGMDAEQTRDLSTRIAATGQQEVQHRMLGMAGQQGTNTQKLLGIASGLNADVTRLQQQVMQQAQLIDDLGRQVRATRQSNQKRMR